MNHSGHLPRALRVGIISDKRVILERLLPPGQPADLGSDPRCALRIPGQPRPLRLFSHRRGAYYLHVQPGMSGVIARGGQRVALPGGGQLAILEGDRGKVSAGELTILFQLVPAPPEMLGRRGFRRDLVEQEDAVFAGFLSLTSAIATVLVAWVQLTPPVVITSIEDHRERVARVYQLSPPKPAKVEHVPRFKEILRPSREVPPPRDPLEAAIAEARERGGREGAVSETAVLSLLRTHGPTAFSSEENEELREALARFPSAPTGGVGPPTMALRQGRGQGLDEGATIGELQVGGAVGPAQVSGPAPTAPPTARRGVIDTPAPKVKDAPEGAADLIRQAVKRQAPQVRACYERRLNQIPTLSGKLVVAVRVEAGRVYEAAVETNTTGDDELASCVEKAMIRWRFAGVEDAVFDLPFALSIGQD